MINHPFEGEPVAQKFDFPTIIVERERNETFYLQGDPADSVFYLENGHVKLTVLSGDGKEAVVGILGPGAFFGESCLADRRETDVSATALTRSVAKKIAKAEMVLALRKQPQFTEFFLSRVLSRKIRLEEDLADQLCNPCEMRLARTLLFFAEFGQGGHSVPVNPRIDQHTLAAMVGTTQPRISFLLHRFKERGFVDCVDRLRVNRSLLELVRVPPAQENSQTSSPDYLLLNNA
ncbi:MAG: Crp/Fnr family transcriptional regulator [Bryobacteraceae bacterium]